MFEALGIFIKILRSNGKWKGITVVDGMEPITHSQFADDIMMFREATSKEDETIKGALDLYTTISGKYLNKEKYEVYFLDMKNEILQTHLVSLHPLFRPSIWGSPYSRVHSELITGYTQFQNEGRNMKPGKKSGYHCRHDPHDKIDTFGCLYLHNVLLWNDQQSNPGN